MAPFCNSSPPNGTSTRNPPENSTAHPCGSVVRVGYTVLAAGTDLCHQIEVRRSVFLTRLVRVDDEDRARGIIAEQRRAHHDARHHVSAFLIGPGRDVQRSSDDGEPAGTAGIPTLQELMQYRDGRLSDVVVVTTRWFGGIKLGASGLLRTYSEAVGRALDEAALTRRVRQQRFTTTLAMADAGREEAVLRAAGIPVLDLSYHATGVDLTVGRTAEEAADPRRGAADLGATMSGLLGRPVRLSPAGSSWLDL